MKNRERWAFFWKSLMEGVEVKVPAFWYESDVDLFDDYSSLLQCKKRTLSGFSKGTHYKIIRII